MRTGALRVAMLVAALASLAGCAADPATDPPTLSAWQQNLQGYVSDEANGDPNVLAEMSWDDVHHGFAVIGDPDPRRSTDELGLLLAHRRLEGRPWFLFLLGTVREGRLDDLRLVGLNVEGVAFHWAVGPSTETPLLLYRAWSAADRARGSAASPDAPPGPPFPRPGESFDVVTRADAFLVRHLPTGATWELHVRGPVSRPAIAPADSRPALQFRRND